MNNSHKTVIIADQSECFGNSCSEALRAIDYNTITLPSSGELLIDEIKRSQPDIVVVDVILDDMYYSEFASLVRKLDQKQPIIVLATAYNDPLVPRKAKQCGIYSVLIKPIESTVFANRIKEIHNARLRGLEMPRNHIEAYVRNAVLQVGVPSHLNGYHYLTRMIVYSLIYNIDCAENLDLLYDKVSSFYHTRKHLVERAANHAIDVACLRCNLDVYYAMFGYSMRCGITVPTLTEFLSLMIDRLYDNISRICASAAKSYDAAESSSGSSDEPPVDPT